MKYKPITFSVRDYREIKSADIRLNGITILTGPNGCGKASVSKLILSAVAHSAKLDNYILDRVRARTNDLSLKLEDIRRECKPFLDKGLAQICERRFASDLFTVFHTEESLNKLMDFIRFLELALEYKDLEPQNQEGLWRTVKSRSTTTKEGLEGAKHALNEYKCALLQSLYEYKNIEFLQERRETRYFYDALKTDPYFSAENFSVSLDGALIIDTSLPFALPLPEVARVFFWDNPFVQNYNDPDQYIEVDSCTLEDLLEQDEDYTVSADTINLTALARQVGGGQLGDYVDFEYLYKDLEGNQIDLKDCNARQRVFAALHRLLVVGVMTPSMLMAINKPEVHLHPRDVVEFARLIALINKKLGVKFLISTYSTVFMKHIEHFMAEDADRLSVYEAVETEDLDKVTVFDAEAYFDAHPHRKYLHEIDDAPPMYCPVARYEYHELEKVADAELNRLF